MGDRRARPGPRQHRPRPGGGPAKTGNTAPGAAAYRELVGYTDEHDPLGHAPGKGRVEHAGMFRAAHEALALVDAGAEEANLPDGALRARVRACLQPGTHLGTPVGR